MVQVRDNNFASVTFDHELKRFFVVRNFAGPFVFAIFELDVNPNALARGLKFLTTKNCLSSWSEVTDAKLLS